MAEDNREENHDPNETRRNGSEGGANVSGTPSDQPHSRAPSDGGDGRRQRPRVRFTAGGESMDHMNHRARFDLRDGSSSPRMSPRHSLLSTDPAHSTTPEGTPPEVPNQFDHAFAMDESSHHDEPSHDPLPSFQVMKPRPAVRSHHMHASESPETDHPYDDANEKTVSEMTALDRAARLSRRVGTSAPASAGHSPKSLPPSPPPSGPNGLPVKMDDIPLMDLNSKRHVLDEDTESDDEEMPRRRKTGTHTSEAHQLVRMHTKKSFYKDRTRSNSPPPLRSGPPTPVGDRDPDTYVAPPQHYRGGILSSLLKLYNSPGSTPGGAATPSGFEYPRHPAPVRHNSDETGHGSPSHSPSTPGSSGHVTPRSKHQKWYRNKNEAQSTSSLAGLIESSTMMATPAAGLGAGGVATPDTKARSNQRIRPQTGAGKVGAALNRISKPRLEDEIKITVHIAETLARQRYLMKLCRALMFYGAPTHRLEEYMRMTARVLEIDSQFLYIPGCMIISFDDSSTHTTEVKLVRTTQGVDLGKLRDTHDIYKSVVHDVIGVEEATQGLDEILQRKQKHPPWVIVLTYGLASACVGPFAFQARFIDLPIIFGLGTILGTLQLIVAPKSDLYSNVFEISAAVLTSFLARAFGSIRGGNLFCFSALAQSAIALILPGYTVLCGSLELQSRSIVAGSVRMVYAIIYSLFLGFGITIGTAIYGLIDPKRATSATQCQNTMHQYLPFIFVPPFTLCLVVINQAKWKQAPVMVAIAFAGYVVNFFSSKRLPSNAQISNTLGAFAIGVLGNLYSRLHHGLAAAAILPAIFVQVPSGLAASGSLVSGVTSANQLINQTGSSNSTNKTTISNGNDASQVNAVVFNVGYSMIQVAIGITVGLFLSALVVYPLGKRRSGLFSF